MSVAKNVSVNELQARLASLLVEREADGVHFVWYRTGSPGPSFLKYGEYEALLNRLDDLEDVLAMQQALSSPGERGNQPAGLRGRPAHGR